MQLRLRTIGTIIASGLVILRVFFPEHLLTFCQTEISYYAFLFAVLIPFNFLGGDRPGKAKPVPWYDVAMAILSFGIFFWVGLFHKTALDLGWTFFAPIPVVVLGFLAWALSVEAGRRTAGLPFAIVVLVLSLFVYIAPHLPPPWTTTAWPFTRAPAFYLLDGAGIFGPATAAFAQFMIGYLLLGAAISFVGGGEFFIKVASSLVGGMTGAMAKVSVIGSALFGTLSGSSVSNVITVGSLTIPAMKKAGYPSYYAGAVEAVSSTGGQIMPPVMGAVAFVMAELTGISYAQIALAAFIPACLYFIAVYVQIDLQARKLKLAAIPPGERYKLSWKTPVEGWSFIAAAALLAYLIFWPRIIEQAPFFATIPLLIGGVVNRRLTWHTLPALVRSFGNTIITMAGLFACLGLVTGAIVGTAAGVAATSIMLRFAQENMLLVLVLGAATAIVLGMGVSSIAVYLVVALTIVPVLIKADINLMAAHLFILYYACFASLTPPVGLAYMTAAKLADSPPFKTGWKACQLGVVMALVPVYFVHQPSLVLQGDLSQLPFALLTCLFAMVFLGIGFERHVWFFGDVTWPESTVAIVSGLLIIVPFIPGTATTAGWIGGGLLITYWCLKWLLLVSARRNAGFKT